LLDFEIHSLRVVIIEHPCEMSHHELIFALKEVQTCLIFVEGELLQSSVGILTLLELYPGEHFISVSDVGELRYPDYACLELTSDGFSVGDHNLHGRPNQ
jgi:hypothetical protein